MKTRSLHPVLFVLLVVGAAASISAGTAALASNHDHARPRASLAVFAKRHAGPRARLAAEAPPGAVRATVVGTTEVFADQTANGEDCIIYVTPNEGGGSVCEPAAHVAKYGEILIATGRVTTPGVFDHARVAALVPNGVSKLTVTDRDNTTHGVAVENNAGLIGDPRAASLTYSLPDGSKQTVDVAATLDRIPRQPGKAGTAG